MDIETVLSLVGAVGAGSIIPSVVNKLLAKKRDNADIATSNLEIMNEVNKVAKQTITELQAISCYVLNCKLRINGNIKQSHGKQSKRRASEFNSGNSDSSE